jgi:hypothetical protein
MPDAFTLDFRLGSRPLRQGGHGEPVSGTARVQTIHDGDESTADQVERVQERADFCRSLATEAIQLPHDQRPDDA